MRILYFSQDYTVHDHRFLKKLAEMQHEVWFLRFETRPVPLDEHPVPDGVRVIDWMGSHSYKLTGLDKIKLFIEFRSVLRQVRPDLVHAGPVQTCGFFTALAGFKPLLLMSWGYDILGTTDRSQVWKWMTRLTVRSAGLIACDCQAVRNRIIEQYGYPGDRITVFPWGVDLNLFHPAPSRLKLREKLNWQDNKIIISTRSFEPMYGIEVLLKAAVRVLEREPRARFLMLGDGSLRPEVESFIAEHKIEQSAHLAGRVSHDMIADYFNEADLYVSSSYVDGSSVSLLEAMACQLPVIVTDLVSNREWVSPEINGWLMPPGDSEALASAILEALGAEGKARQMGKNNLALAREKADWDVNFKVLLEAYERLHEEVAR